MISSFTVGSIFKIVDEASPALRLILAEVRKLNVALDQARANLAAMGKFAAPAGLTAAVGETSALAKAWKDVAANATLANRAIGSASTTAARAALPAAAAALPAAAAAALPPAAAAAAGAGGGAGGGRHRPGWLGGGGGGGGMHFRGPGVGLPGGGHMRGGGAAMAGAGLLGYGVYEAAEMEDAVWQLIYHSKGKQDDVTRAKFRKILQDSMLETGYGLKETKDAALQEIRMFQGTPGGGVDVLPEMLTAAGKEARAKGNTLGESMRSFIGLAHMTKSYDPEAIKKLARPFAYLSTANPSSLGSIERAASYAVPILQSGMDIDPMEALLLGTALTRAGATNSKSGTWLREMAVRAMPGTSLISSIAARKHNAGLKSLGLLDDKGNPTWFTDGKPDLFKMMDISREHLQAMPLTQRVGVTRQVFGAQGSNALSMLSDPKVAEQITNMRREMNSPEFKNQYGSFFPDYAAGSTVQAARTGMAEFNVTMMDIAKITLPAVNNALGGFKSALEGIRSILPGGEGKGGAVIGGHAILGAAAGAATGGLIGAFGGPVGAFGGAAIGAVAGGMEGVAEQYMRQREHDLREGGRDRVEEMYRPRLRLGGERSEAAPKVTLSPNLSISLNIDGQMLAHAVTDAMGNNTGFVTQAPAADGSSVPSSGDHNWGDR
jgi:uncharacterized protein YcfJ